MKTQTKKLTLNKETLRDLTPQNDGQVKGGSDTNTCTINHCATYYCTNLGCTLFKCQGGGKTNNKKCLR